jgi:Ca-activated chloride channel family protein
MTPWMKSAVCVVAVLVVGCSKKSSAPVPPPPAPPPAKAPAPAPAGSIKVNTAEPVDGDVTLKGPSTIVAGSPIEVTFTAPNNAQDYVDLVPRGNTQTSGELTFVYVRDFATGSKLVALSKPGEYDLRYVLDLKGARTVKAVVPLTITAATAQLTAPAQATGAEPLSIQWTGPGRQNDYVDIVPAGVTATSGEITYTYTRDGNPTTVTAPGKAGAYEIRYVLDAPGGRVVLATSPLTVTLPVATLNGPEQGAPGAKVIVEYTGPRRKGDYVDLVKKGYEPTSGELTYFYVAAAPAEGQPAELKHELELPKEKGVYELRYVMAAPQQRVVLVRRAISVK